MGATRLGWQVQRIYDDGEYMSVNLIYGSSAYDTAQMSRLIDQLIQDAKALGIETLPPEKFGRDDAGMARSKRTKALAISPEVKERVYERDNGRCIWCGGRGIPNAHYIPRSLSGLGCEQNILTLCPACHRRIRRDH